MAHSGSRTAEIRSHAKTAHSYHPRKCCSWLRETSARSSNPLTLEADYCAYLSGAPGACKARLPLAVLGFNIYASRQRHARGDERDHLVEPERRNMQSETSRRCSRRGSRALDLLPFTPVVLGFYNVGDRQILRKDEAVRRSYIHIKIVS